jgi:hypothetical protein
VPGVIPNVSPSGCSEQAVDHLAAASAWRAVAMGEVPARAQEAAGQIPVAERSIEDDCDSLDVEIVVATPAESVRSCSTSRAWNTQRDQSLQAYRIPCR